MPSICSRLMERRTDAVQTPGGLVLFRQLRMRGAAGMDDQTFGVIDIGKQTKQLMLSTSFIAVSSPPLTPKTTMPPAPLANISARENTRERDLRPAPDNAPKGSEDNF